MAYSISELTRSVMLQMNWKSMGIIMAYYLYIQDSELGFGELKALKYVNIG
jgi:hypothetical protein